MKTGKKITDLFRECGENLSIQPSAGAWNKLERRLEGRGSKRQGRVVAMRWISAIAATLVLTFGIYWWSNNSMRRDSYSLLDSPAPASLEELSGTGTCEPYCLMLSVRDELPEYYAFPANKEW